MKGLPSESYLSNASMSPLFQLQRHIVSFLQWTFGKQPAGSYRFVSDNDPDSTESEIFIGADTPINTKMVGKRPAITVLRGPASFQGVGFNDRSGFRSWDGTRTKLDIIPTTLQVNVLSKIPMEAEQLAWFVAEQIWGYSDEIVDKAPFIHSMGARATISPPSPAGSFVNSTDYEWTVVVCSYPVYLTHQITSQPLNLRRFESELGLNKTVKPLGGDSNAVGGLPTEENNGHNKVAE